MAEHDTKELMIREALQEYIEVAKYCINFDKTTDEQWRSTAGCYGYPAGLLLLSIVDAIGAEVVGGRNNTKQHFTILNHVDYYNLNLSEDILEALRREYRNHLSHNAQIGERVILDIGTKDDKIIETYEEIYKLNLKPFYLISEKVVNRFL
ncbi:hypothetical protein N9L26_02675 [Candidatus Pacebacteria bacterium]|nr:hypothetical protein [Candidatus Paceibacterota bacterium]